MKKISKQILPTSRNRLGGGTLSKKDQPDGLKKFSKNTKQKKIVISAIIGLILLVGGITLYKAFALYEEKKEFNVLRGRVPNFNDVDIKLAFTIDGETKKGTLFPNRKEGYVVKQVNCVNGVTAEWNNSTWGLVNIQNKNASKVECTIDFTSSIPLSENVEVGDYIVYKPKSSEYKILGSYTGTSEQTINPSELTLWRVLQKNEDGSIEIISEFASSTQVTFYGKVGFKNLAGTLNRIAEQYENEDYTIDSRNPGYYQGQTEYLNSLCTTIGCTEPNGGGDITLDGNWAVTSTAEGYNNDRNLITSIFGTNAIKIGTTERVKYWYTTRTYLVRASDYNHAYISEGDIVFYNNLPQPTETGGSRSIRPIVILKSGLDVSGAGTEDNPYKVN